MIIALEVTSIENKQSATAQLKDEREKGKLISY